MVESAISEVILDILRREGADTTMILGSRLGLLVREEHGDLLRTAMEQEGLAFVRLVERIPDVSVMRDAGTGLDVLIGLEGALPPTPPGEPQMLRPDVYAAFTRLGARYSYDPEADLFHEGPPAEDNVECPAVLLEDLTELRREFASTIEEPSRSELLATLDEQERSLGRFRDLVMRKRLSMEWGQHVYRALSVRVRDWATAQDLPINPSWFFVSESDRIAHSGPRGLLRELVGFMTDEEVRGVNIPISTIERYLSRRSRHPLA